MTQINNDNKEDIIENWDHEIQPNERDNLHKLLEVVASQNARLDVDLDEIYDNRFLGTATGNELEKIGELVGVVRKRDEPDKKLQKRIRGAFSAHASDTTYRTFTSIALSILEATPESVEFITPPESNPKQIELQLDGSILEQNPLAKEELVILLNGSVSIDAEVVINEIGTFAFAGDDDTLEGWDKGTWSVAVNN